MLENGHLGLKFVLINKQSLKNYKVETRFTSKKRKNWDENCAGETSQYLSGIVNQYVKIFILICCRI